MGTVALEVAPQVATEVKLEVTLVVAMSRNEEDIGRTKSTFSLVFLCFFGPCFWPDALVSMLIATTDESPPLIFCPLYQVTNLSRVPSTYLFWFEICACTGGFKVFVHLNKVWNTPSFRHNGECPYFGVPQGCWEDGVWLGEYSTSFLPDPLRDVEI